MKAAFLLYCRAVPDSQSSSIYHIHFAGIKTTQVIMLFVSFVTIGARCPSTELPARSPATYLPLLFYLLRLFRFMFLAFWSCLLAACFLFLSLSFLPPLSPIACSFRRTAFYQAKLPDNLLSKKYFASFRVRLPAILMQGWHRRQRDGNNMPNLEQKSCVCRGHLSFQSGPHPSFLYNFSKMFC